MRVLQIIPSIKSTFGGPPRSTLANCRALHAVDPEMETVLLTTDEGLNPEWREELLAQCPEGMKIEVTPGTGRHTGQFSLPLLRWIWHNAEDFDLAVIRLLLHPISSSAARVATLCGLPYVLAPHGTLSEYTFRHRRTVLKLLYYRLVESGTVGEAAAIRFTACAERREAERLGFDTPAVVIPHPFAPPASRFSAESSRSDRILFLARLHPVKGVDLLLKAMQIVQREASGSRLVLAGSGPKDYERDIRSQIEGLGLEEVVKLPGFVEGEEKRRLLTESGLFVLLSEHESFGLSVVEAMASGLPVVISKGVAIWPKIEEAGAGIVLEECSSNAAAKAILHLLDGRQEREEMGRNGRELVQTVLDPRHVGRSVGRLYRAATEGPSRVRKEFS